MPLKIKVHLRILRSIKKPGIVILALVPFLECVHFSEQTVLVFFKDNHHGKPDPRVLFTCNICMKLHKI